MTVMHLMWWPAWVCKWSIFSWSTTLQIVQPNGVAFLHQRHARSCNDWLWRESRRSGHGFGCVGFCMQWTWWLSSPKRENSTEELNENISYNFPFQFHTVKRNKDQPVLYLLALYYIITVLGSFGAPHCPIDLSRVLNTWTWTGNGSERTWKKITWKEMNGKDSMKVSTVSIPNSRIWHVNWSRVRCVKKQIWKTNDRKNQAPQKLDNCIYHPLLFSREWAHFIHYPFTNHFWTWNECKAHEWYWRTDWQWPVAVQCFFLELGWASLRQQNRETLVSPVMLLHIFPFRMADCCVVVDRGGFTFLSLMVLCFPAMKALKRLTMESHTLSPCRLGAKMGVGGREACCTALSHHFHEILRTMVSLAYSLWKDGGGGYLKLSVAFDGAFHLFYIRSRKKRLSLG